MDFQEEHDSSWEFQKENTDDWFVGRVNHIKYHRKHSSRDVNKVSDSSPKIHRIPQYMAERVEFRKYYEAQIISIGPIHLAKIDTLQGKPYKDAWTAMDKLVRVHQDLLILNNQIPFPWLRVLCNDDQRLEKCLHNFLHVHGIESERA
ncbi:DUF247 domain protein [Arachis hypogaea]|nr:DUF247 domain protein [Arachis hypogaea]